MSKFIVERTYIETVEPHENADRLDVATLKGRDFSLVVQKGLYRAGDEVFYFPVDSLLPMILVRAMGLDGKLAHGTVPDADKERLQNRVKTVKLRGVLSQGIVCDVNTIKVVFELTDEQMDSISIGDDIKDLIGVTKYEPPVIPMRNGALSPLPAGVSHYDIESAQNFPDIVETALSVPKVSITEKIEGSNWWINVSKDGIRVGQRNYEIVDVTDYQHDWYKVLQTQELERKAQKLFDYLNENRSVYVDNITLRGEIIGPGIQGNYYKLDDHKVLMFDLEINGIPVSPNDFYIYCKSYDIDMVPELTSNVYLKEWLNGKTIKEAADGQSVLNCNVKREGIVIKPMVPAYDHRIGRVFLKQHSLSYLAKSKL